MSEVSTRLSYRFWFDVRVNAYELAELLPDIPALRDRCRALAMIEAIVCPEWQ